MHMGIVSPIVPSKSKATNLIITLHLIVFLIFFILLYCYQCITHGSTYFFHDTTILANGQNIFSKLPLAFFFRITTTGVSARHTFPVFFFLSHPSAPSGSASFLFCIIFFKITIDFCAK